MMTFWVLQTFPASHPLAFRPWHFQRVDGFNSSIPSKGDLAGLGEGVVLHLASEIGRAEMRHPFLPFPISRPDIAHGAEMGIALEALL